MTPLVIDIETTIKNKDVGDFLADPEYPDNWIVAYGWQLGDDPIEVVYAPIKTSGTLLAAPEIGSDVIVVGQNVAFDLYFLARRSSEWRDFIGWGSIWDTMIVHYLITGQFEKYVNLDILALIAAGADQIEIEYYKQIPKLKAQALKLHDDGDLLTSHAIQSQIAAFYDRWEGVLKDNAMKEYWEAGIQTEDIPREELLDYLKGDVRNTKAVFEYQLNIVQQMDLFSLVWVQMEARMATLEMQLNGTYINMEILDELATKRKIEQFNAVLTVKNSIMEIQGYSGDSFLLEALNAGSPYQLSCALFGGTCTFSKRETMLDENGLIIRFKSGARKGEVRRQVVKVDYTFNQIADAVVYSTPTKTVGVYKTGDEVLKKIIDECKNPDAVKLAKDIIALREINKDVSTYYEGYSTLVWPHDSCIHPSYQHCSTDTGRLSCSKPNLQQVTGKG